MKYDFYNKSFVLDMFDTIFDMYVFDIYRQVTHEIYRANVNKSQYDYKTLIMVYNYILFQYGEEFVNLCDRISHSHYEKTRRVRRRVENIVSTRLGKFLTLTFTDECLEQTNKLTRRKYITRFLNTLNPIDFVANIDFGDLYDREHYHAVIACENIDFNLYKYGNIDVEKIRNTGDDDVKLSRYLNKLTNHSLKESTNGGRIIYKR